MSTDELIKIDIPSLDNENKDNDSTEESKDSEEQVESKQEEQYINLDGPWNYKIQLLLKKIGEKCMGYRWMHNKEQRYYENMDEKYTIIELILVSIITTVTGSEFVALFASSNLADHKTAIIIVTGIQLLLTLIC